VSLTALHRIPAVDGEQIEIMKPNGDNVLATVLALVDEDGNEMESCPHPQQVFYVKLSETPDVSITIFCISVIISTNFQIIRIF